MPFKHKSGSRKRQERKEQEKKVAKLPKLDYFGFLPSSSTSRQPTESAMDNAPANSSAAGISIAALSGVSATMQQVTMFTVRNVPAESQTRLSSLCTHPSR